MAWLVFMYNTLPFDWSIDDRHNGQLQVSLDEGEYATLSTTDERNFVAAKSIIFLVTYYLVRVGYSLGLSESILVPVKIVPYFGFLADSSRDVFHLNPEKKIWDNPIPWRDERHIQVSVATDVTYSLFI